MFLKSIQLTNFRNIKDQVLTLSESFNLIIGKNAQGKTNILEGIFLLARGRSFRTPQFTDLIYSGEPNGRLVGRIDLSSGRYDDVKLCIAGGRKIFDVNGKPRRVSSYDGIRVVLFSPEEILLLKSPPSARRDYLDDLIASFDRNYGKISSDYGKVVSHKNRLLSEGVEGDRNKVRGDILIWNERLVELGAKIWMGRLKWLDKIDKIFRGQYKLIAPLDPPVNISYLCSFCDRMPRDLDDATSIIGQMLRDRFEDELMRGFSIVGTHRDDFVVSLGDRAAKGYASQGQSRTAVLALKMAELDLHMEIFGDFPILLLDDVLSELDSDRANLLLEHLSAIKAQVFVTNTDVDFIKKFDFKDNVVFTVEGGRIV